jgi:hypothetical protein
MAQTSSNARLQAAIAADRRRIAAGERPLYHVTWTTTPDGSTADVTIRELPIMHVFVPDCARVLDAARGLVARTLSVDPASFDVVIDQP